MSPTPFDSIAGQDHVVSILRRALENRRLASAYLFEGPSGVGKERTALALAQAVIEGAAEQPGNHGERIAAGTHPDVRIFRPRDDGHRNIKVDTLREEILPYAEFAPFEGEHAFLIFPEVDVSFPRNHPESANAILKTLEEPKKGVTFILLAERPDRLLPTIRSRCQALRFGRLSEAAIAGILEANAVPEEHRLAALALADGRADRALALAEDGLADALLDQALAVDEALTSSGPGQLVAAADGLAKSEHPVLLFDALMLFYRDIAAICAGLGDEALAFRHAAPKLRRRAKLSDVARSAERVAQIQATLDDLEMNANRAVACDALVHRVRGPQRTRRILPPRRLH